jgi:hypothetical protein
MPRSATRPTVGDIVWYMSASPPNVLPQAALVVNIATVAGSGFGIPLPGSGPVLDLVVWDATGTSSVKTGVQFYYGTRPTSGQWCTMRRVNMPASASSWPSGSAVGE